MLEDLMAAAFNDARGKAEAAGAESMSQAMGGMALRPASKCPSKGPAAGLDSP
jgi:DNA-binding protein YbaB